MKPKHILLFLLCAALLLSATACDRYTTDDNTLTETETDSETVEDTTSAETTTSEETEPESETEDLGTNIIVDPTFQNGFKLLGVDGTVCKTLPGKSGEATDPTWILAQWWCNNHLENGIETRTDTTYSIVDASKEVAVDWERGSLALGLTGSQEFDTWQEVAPTAWPHLLIEQELPLTSLKDAESVTATLTYTITENVDSRDSQGRGHFGQLAWFIYIQDRNPDSEGYGNFLWFGLNLFSVSTISTGSYAAQDYANGPGNFIYSVGSGFFLDRRMKVGAPTEIHCNILPFIEDALETAHGQGFMVGTEIEDISITGMNLGWEIQDRWDSNVTIENIGLYVK